MKDDKISVLVFIYNSYKDPLFQNLLLNYIKTLSEKGNYRFDLITFEQPEYRLTPAQMINEKEKLKNSSIYWHPLTFHTGSFLLFKKLIDVFATVLKVMKIKLLYRSKFVFVFANVAASFSILFKKMLGLRMVIYSYEPHSQFMLELGHWQSYSPSYQILSRLEKLAGKYADFVMTGTKHGVQLLHGMGSRAQIFRAPTAVDPVLFKFDEANRNKIRNKYNIENKNVFLYMGKFGGLYYERETIEICNQLFKLNSNAHFLIVTTFDHSQIRDWFKEENISDKHYTLAQNLTDDEVKEYLSASDFGISAVPPSPSQKFRSPTKVAEYLLCGLPYITCLGVSEDDEIALENQVGVVLNNFSKQEIDDNYKQIKSLLKEDPSIVRERCRKTGLTYRSSKYIENLLEDIFQRES